MKIIRKKPIYVGCTYIGKEVVPEYMCPNKKCGFGVSEDWLYCPYCGQRLGEFCENKDTKHLMICLGLRKAKKNEIMGKG